MAVGVVCGAEVSTILVDEENDEISDESDGIDIEDEDEVEVEAVADAELGLEIPIVLGKNILFFAAQQSCELSAPQHQLPSSSHSDI